MSPDDITIRPLSHRDIDDVMRVDRQEDEDDRDFEQYESCIESTRRHAWVAVLNGSIVGFAAMKICGLNVMLERVVVVPHLRRMGIGLELVRHIIRIAERENRVKLVIYVREAQLGHQLFFKKIGLDHARVIPGYFKKQQENAIILWKVLKKRSS